MRKTISMYWPLAIVVPLAAAAYLHAMSDEPSRGPLAVHQASAELARAVSFGLVDDAAKPISGASGDAMLAAPKAL
ncbi:hypothetical protein QZM46_28520 [Burkholderia vietnamiensis]|jgi:hypothetical protein|uniref:Uncharacterized protein n=1 Tax=Burkholderia vietnamiensis TaxID=60552 RepID=A0A118EVE3_BURVI|nr:MULTISPECIES: hypothetical protein [Burkholderia]TPQ45654.1 hypothetical protein C2U71_11835 [Burkholderia ubonensis]AFJ86273.1 hypothetical protein MYA_1912 [Burkholderia sp. KJ006]AOJ13821.1 hypothetical protein WJ02_09680 [Burkholderia vietnamiensis]AOK00701.1 hypothetical protein WK23_19860 [Burkholderia vietnamiensis]AOK41373.1 hypothetical protein WL96_10145 [Burkholderia vietnamiensis]